MHFISKNNLSIKVIGLGASWRHTNSVFRLRYEGFVIFSQLQLYEIILYAQAAVSTTPTPTPRNFDFTGCKIRIRAANGCDEFSCPVQN